MCHRCTRGYPALARYDRQLARASAEVPTSVPLSPDTTVKSRGAWPTCPSLAPSEQLGAGCSLRARPWVRSYHFTAGCCVRVRQVSVLPATPRIAAPEPRDVGGHGRRPWRAQHASSEADGPAPGHGAFGCMQRARHSLLPSLQFDGRCGALPDALRVHQRRWQMHRATSSQSIILKTFKVMQLPRVAAWGSMG